MKDETQSDQRKNTATARILDAGIDISEREGRYPAAAYMLANGATFRAIVRVLSEPLYRRGFELKS